MSRSPCVVEGRGGEDLGGGEAAGVLPVGPVRGESDGGVVVSEDSAGGGIGAVGEDGVVFGEAVFGGGGRGDDDDGEAAEVELHHGAVLLGEGLERAVRRCRFEEVEVAEYRQRQRAGRRLFVLAWIRMLWNQENANEHEHAAQQNQHFCNGINYLLPPFLSSQI